MMDSFHNLSYVNSQPNMSVLINFSALFPPDFDQYLQSFQIEVGQVQSLPSVKALALEVLTEDPNAMSKAPLAIRTALRDQIKRLFYELFFSHFQAHATSEHQMMPEHWQINHFIKLLHANKTLAWLTKEVYHNTEELPRVMAGVRAALQTKVRVLLNSSKATSLAEVSGPLTALRPPSLTSPESVDELARYRITAPVEL